MYLFRGLHSWRIPWIGRGFLIARAIGSRPTPSVALLWLTAVLQILLLFEEERLFVLCGHLQLAVGAAGLANDGPGYHVGKVLVGLDAVHVFV